MDWRYNSEVPLPPSFQIKYAVLDLDDTLVACSRAKARARKAVRAMGVDTRGLIRVEETLWAAFSRGEITWPELRWERWRQAGVKDAEAAAVDLAYGKFLFSVNLTPHAKRVLGEMRRNGLKIAVLTNGPTEGQRKKIRDTGLEGMVDALIDAQSTGAPKPHPLAYAAALAALGGNPQEAVMAGDSWAHDVAGALEAGFGRAIWVSRGRAAPRDVPNEARVVRNMAGVPGAIFSLEAQAGD